MAASSPHRLAALVFIAALLSGPSALAWQDLSHDFVGERVAEIADPTTPREARQLATWTLLSVGRPAVGPLIETARKRPELAWSAMHLLDALRTDASVVRAFSAFLDAPPQGLKSSGEVRGFLSSRLEDMVGRSFDSPAERRRWVARNADFLDFSPAAQRFRLRVSARSSRRPLIPTPAATSPSAAVEAAFHRLLMALHSGYRPAVEALVGPAVTVAALGGRTETTLQLDIDAFADPPMNHRAYKVSRRGRGWLVRTKGAWFSFDGGAAPRCVGAGMKPLD